MIGQTSDNKFATYWELAYHEILSICNKFQNITSGVIDFRDNDLHHEFICNLNLEPSLRVVKIFDYINSKTNLFQCFIKDFFGRSGSLFSFKKIFFLE